MPIHYPDILQQSTPPSRFTYTSKDVMLYALGIGLGTDPVDRNELQFVYEKSLRVFPTAVTALALKPHVLNAPPRVPSGMRLSTYNLLKVLHGEQKIEVHRPLPPEGSFTIESRTVAAMDKGIEKGAVLVSETIWTGDDGRRAVTSTASMFARGDGGFGGPSTGGPTPHAIPTCAPDASVDISTRPEQGLIYRLSGDYNPLHCDPDVAIAAGFPKPILHGLCTYGITCRAVLRTFLNYDSDAIVSHQVRFSSPVYPGEVITVDMWRHGNTISFGARVKERNATVIRNGKTVVR
jgi:acyl dehydratase